VLEQIGEHLLEHCCCLAVEKVHCLHDIETRGPSEELILTRELDVQWPEFSVG